MPLLPGLSPNRPSSAGRRWTGSRRNSRPPSEQSTVSPAPTAPTPSTSLCAVSAWSGDEVITTAHSWISTSETVTQAGGQVVFCDTEADTFNIDPERVEAAITPHGRDYPCSPLRPASCDGRDNGDRGEAWAVGHRGLRPSPPRPTPTSQLGTLGDAATFSFYPGKNFGALGDSGCLVTGEDQLAAWCVTFARHGGKGTT